MKKFSKIFSAVALLMAVIVCFSGCGVIDYARSVVKKNGDAGIVSIGNTQDGEVIPGTGDVTNSAALTPADESITAAQSTGSTASGTSAVTSSASSQSKPSAGTSSAGSQSSATTSAGSSSGDTITEEELKDMPVKEVQDLLFATEDPNTAGKILNLAGFEYDEKQGIYYSHLNPLQRYFGFNFVYDMAAPMVGMVYDTKRIEFVYNDKQWMIQIWKGQYGITSGAEVGLYNRPLDRVIQYDCADDEELIEMQFDFYNQNEFVFSRGPEKHWWLTGFKILNVGVPMLIDLDITLKFNDKLMAQAFAKSLKKTAGTSLLDPITYTVKGSTVNIKW